MPTVGERVKQVRQSLNMNQKAFADYLDMSQTHISKIENGKDNPSEKLLKRMVAVLGVDYAWLADGVGTMWEDKDGYMEVLDSALEVGTPLFEEICELSKSLNVHEKKDIFDILLVVKWMLATKYDNPTEKSLAIKSMRDVFNYTYYAFIETYRSEDPVSPQVADSHEREWRSVCEESINNIKDVFLYKHGE